MLLSSYFTIMKTNYFLISVLLLNTTVCNSQSFQQFINKLEQTDVSRRQSIADSFISVCKQFPFIENDSLVHWIYLGNVGSVAVAGDGNNWNPSKNQFTRISTTNLWYLTEQFEPDARLDYKYVIDSTNWILDPLNPKIVMSGFGANSELSMPLYVQPPEIEYYPAIPHGSIFDTVMISNTLGNSRTVKVYLPADYSASKNDYPVILFHDGLDFLTLANTQNVLDYLIAKNSIEPIIGVFIPAVNREEEYAGSQMNAFTDFIVQDVMHWVDKKYRTRIIPAFRAVAGVSNGGNISLWMGITHPEQFGKIGAYSSNVIEPISDSLLTRNFSGLDFYIDIGKYDIPVLIPMAFNLRDILQQKGS